MPNLDNHIINENENENVNLNVNIDTTQESGTHNVVQPNSHVPDSLLKPIYCILFVTLYIWMLMSHYFVYVLLTQALRMFDSKIWHKHSKCLTTKEAMTTGTD